MFDLFISIILTETKKTPASSKIFFVKPVVKSAIMKRINVITITIVLPDLIIFSIFLI